MEEIGKLRHKLEIQKEISPPVRDAFGAEKPQWTTVAYRYAEIFGLGKKGSTEDFVAGHQVQGDSTYKIRMRYYPIAPKMRLFWRGRNRAFNVIAMANAGDQLKSTLIEVLASEES